MSVETIGVVAQFNAHKTGMESSCRGVSTVGDDDVAWRRSEPEWLWVRVDDIHSAERGASATLHLWMGSFCPHGWLALFLYHHSTTHLSVCVCAVRAMAAVVAETRVHFHLSDYATGAVLLPHSARWKWRLDSSAPFSLHSYTLKSCVCTVSVRDSPSMCLIYMMWFVFVFVFLPFLKPDPLRSAPPYSDNSFPLSSFHFTLPTSLMPHC